MTCFWSRYYDNSVRLLKLQVHSRMQNVNHMFIFLIILISSFLRILGKNWNPLSWPPFISNDRQNHFFMNRKLLNNDGQPFFVLSILYQAWCREQFIKWSQLKSNTTHYFCFASCFVVVVCLMFLLLENPVDTRMNE